MYDQNVQCATWCLHQFLKVKEYIALPKKEQSQPSNYSPNILPIPGLLLNSHVLYDRCLTRGILTFPNNSPVLDCSPDSPQLIVTTPHLLLTHQ